jgi:hypothetical protein
VAVDPLPRGAHELPHVAAAAAQRRLLLGRHAGQVLLQRGTRRVRGRQRALDGDERRRVWLRGVGLRFAQ